MKDKGDTKLEKQKAKQEQWLNWLLTFKDLELGGLTPRQLLKVRAKMFLFIYQNVGGDTHPYLEGDASPQEKPAREKVYKEMTINKLAEMQQEIREAFSILLPVEESPTPTNLPPVDSKWRRSKSGGGPWHVPLVKNELYIWSGGTTAAPHLNKYYVAGWEDSFWLAVVTLLETIWLHLRRCTECGTLFLRTKRQEYCSRQCALRIRQRRYYAGHKEELRRKRREKYQRQIQEEAAKHGKRR